MESARGEGELLSLLGQSGDDGGVAVACKNEEAKRGMGLNGRDDGKISILSNSARLPAASRSRCLSLPFQSTIALTLVNGRVSAQAVNVLVSLSIPAIESALSVAPISPQLQAPKRPRDELNYPTHLRIPDVRARGLLKDDREGVVAVVK